MMLPGEKLASFCVNAGPHPQYSGGPWWQIAFVFGDVDVSIAFTPDTKGVELMVHGLSNKPLTNVTPAKAVMILDLLLERLEAKRGER